MSKRHNKEKVSRAQVDEEIKQGKRLPNGHNPGCKCMECFKIRVSFLMHGVQLTLKDVDRRLTGIEVKIGLTPRQPEKPVIDLVQKDAIPSAVDADAGAEAMPAGTPVSSPSLELNPPATGTDGGKEGG
jgi:hypothetical protein